LGPEDLKLDPKSPRYGGDLLGDESAPGVQEEGLLQLLAPMEDVSDLPFRVMLLRMGADAVVHGAEKSPAKFKLSPRGASGGHPTLRGEPGSPHRVG